MTKDASFAIMHSMLPDNLKKNTPVFTGKILFYDDDIKELAESAGTYCTDAAYITEREPLTKYLYAWQHPNDKRLHFVKTEDDSNWVIFENSELYETDQKTDQKTESKLINWLRK